VRGRICAIRRWWVLVQPQSRVDGWRLVLWAVAQVVGVRKKVITDDKKKSEMGGARREG
jgi:hypothetical protein